MRMISKIAGIACFCGMLLLGMPAEASAAQIGPEVTTSSSYVVKIEAPQVALYASADEGSSKTGQVQRGQTYQVLGTDGSGWVKIQADGSEGYIRVSGNASLVEKTRETVDQSAKKRRETVEYALQFVGGRYVYGGTDPNTGVDCSGFTRYIMANAASINLPHSSRGQSSYGREVTLDPPSFFLTMQIKVITRHTPNNYGSLLQSIATLRVIESLGHQCEIIDYLCMLPLFRSSGQGQAYSTPDTPAAGQSQHHRLYRRAADTLY